MHINRNKEVKKIWVGEEEVGVDFGLEEDPSVICQFGRDPVGCTGEEHVGGY